MHYRMRDKQFVILKAQTEVIERIFIDVSCYISRR